jgi:hypothetical protein
MTANIALIIAGVLAAIGVVAELGHRWRSRRKP